MIKIDDRLYKAEEGCFIREKATGNIMGEGISLGDGDSAENYEDSPYTEESRREFYESIGLREEVSNGTKYE